MRRIYVLVIFVLYLSSVSFGQAVDFSAFGIDTTGSNIPKGLKAGDKAPGFTGYDQTGKTVELKKLLEQGPVVLFFYRGKWSQECSRYLNSYQDSVNIITGLGATLVAITPESIENVEQTVKFHNLTFRVIYDCQERMMKDYGLMYNVTKAYIDKIKSTLSIDIAENNGRDLAHLPVTATYIINRESIITAVYFNPDFNKRASVKWMVKNLASSL